MDKGSRHSLMFNLGRFVGHIVHGLRADVRSTSPTRREVRRDVEEARSVDGSVTLRRTTIEEIEMHPRKEER